MKQSLLFSLVVMYHLLALGSSLNSSGVYYFADDSDYEQEHAECKLWNFLFDENQSSLGLSKCNNDCQCDGKRQCVNGCCTGWPRVAADMNLDSSLDECLHQNYKFQLNPDQTCSSQCDCYGNRICSTSGHCHGTAVYDENCQPEIATPYFENENEKVMEIDSCMSELDLVIENMEVKTDSSIKNFDGMSYVISNVKFDVNQENLNSNCLKTIISKLQYKSSSNDEYIYLPLKYIHQNQVDNMTIEIPLVELMEMLQSNNIIRLDNLVLTLKIMIGQEDFIVRSHEWSIDIDLF